MGAVAIVFYAVSAILAGVSAYTAQKSANKRLDYQSKVAKNNAIIADYQGKHAKGVALKKAQLQQRQTAAFVGKQRAAMGSSGLVADEGTFLDLTLDTTEQGNLDELAILHEGDMEAWRAEISGGNYVAQSELYNISKTDPGQAGGISLMSGVADAGIGYYQMQDRKVEMQDRKVEVK